MQMYPIHVPKRWTMEDKDPKDMILADAIRTAIEASRENVILTMLNRFLSAIIIVEAVIILTR